MWDILVRYHEGFIGGLVVTLQLTCIVWFLGLSVGSVIGWFAHRFGASVGRVLSLFSFLGSSIPVIVILFWAHYPLQVLLKVVINPFVTAVWVLALVNTLAVADIVRAAVSQFPQQYITAARVCGLSPRMTFMKIDRKSTRLNSSH